MCFKTPEERLELLIHRSDKGQRHGSVARHCRAHQVRNTLAKIDLAGKQHPQRTGSCRHRFIRRMPEIRVHPEGNDMNPRGWDTPSGKRSPLHLGTNKDGIGKLELAMLALTYCGRIRLVNRGQAEFRPRVRSESVEKSRFYPGAIKHPHHTPVAGHRE